MKDLLLEDNDLHTADGDFVSAETDLQNQSLLLQCDKGDFKENPTVCVGIVQWLKDDEDPSGLTAEIKKEFERDGMEVKKIQIAQDGTLSIDASY